MLVILAILVFYRIGRRGEYLSVTGLAQGTTYMVTYENRGTGDLKPEIDSILADFDMSLSTYLENSLISRFNRNDSLAEADDKFRDVFNKSREVYAMTDGAFDITVAPIVNALGFGATEMSGIDSASIDSLKRFVGMDKVALEGNKLVKKVDGLKLDVNAIAQGYSVDVVASYLKSKKIRNFLVEIGGEVRTRGRNPDNLDWLIGIDRPVEGNMMPGVDLQAIIRLSGRSLATSGNYRRFFEKDGIKYVHTINPETGYPVLSNLLSATVVSADCMTADAYATAFMVMGLDRSVAFLEQHDFLEGYLIYSDNTGDYRIYMSEGLKPLIEERP